MDTRENRAVAPVWPGPPGHPASVLATPPTPSPSPIPDTIPGAAALEGKSRTLQGPSAKEWARHRDTIISLYRQYPLKRVSDIMRREYGFLASKRMYDKRFREWNVFKNVNSDERGRVSRRAQGPASPASPRDNSNFSQEDLRRTLRCARTIQQGVRRPAAATSPPTLFEAPSRASPQPNLQPRRSISISDLLEVKLEDAPSGIVAPAFSGHEKPPQLSFSPPATPGNTPGASPASPHDTFQEQDNSAALVVAGSTAAGLADYQAQIQKLFNAPLRSISPDSQTRTMSTITLKLREYYDWQLENIPAGVLPDEYLGNRSSDESTRYWNTIKNAIYLVKLAASPAEATDPDNHPDRRAWSAFAEAGTLAAGAMTSQPFDFLRNLFATLSPVNTSARPELRKILLRFLNSEAQNSLSSNHPITHITKELLDDQDCQEISQRSLQCMLDIFNSRLGRSRAITFKLLDSLATLLRRSGQYHAGLEIVTELLEASRPVFGPESDEVRALENELAHFYMLADEDELALGHCMSVVTRPPGSESHSEGQQQQPAFYQDGIAAHTMEDIAEIHQRRGDMEQCITWLERAASIALVVWGPKAVATGHLIDKMTGLQRQFGKDLLKSATMWEAAII